MALRKQLGFIKSQIIKSRLIKTGSLNPTHLNPTHLFKRKLDIFFAALIELDYEIIFPFAHDYRQIFILNKFKQ